MRLFLVVLLAFVLTGCAASTTPVYTISITTETLPAGTVGEIYAQQLAVSGGVPPYRWNVISGVLPTGITLSSAGVLSGIPTNSGPFNFTVQVVDSASSSDQIHIRGKE